MDEWFASGTGRVWCWLAARRCQPAMAAFLSASAVGLSLVPPISGLAPVPRRNSTEITEHTGRGIDIDIEATPAFGR